MEWAVSPALVIAPLFPVGYLAWRYWNGNARIALLAALAAAVLLWGLIELAGAAPGVATHARSACDRSAPGRSDVEQLHPEEFDE